MNKIKKEFGPSSGEELFKPITKRLEKSPGAGTAEEEEGGGGGGGGAKLITSSMSSTELTRLVQSSCQRLKQHYQHLHRCLMIMNLTFLRYYHHQ